MMKKAKVFALASAAGMLGVALPLSLTSGGAPVVQEACAQSPGGECNRSPSEMCCTEFGCAPDYADQALLKEP